MLSLLEQGGRLECPISLVTLPQVYERMLRTWEQDIKNRPTFAELVEFLEVSIVDLPASQSVTRDLAFIISGSMVEV